MAKASFQTIDVASMTGNITINAKSKYAGLYFKGAKSFNSVITKVEGSDTGNDLTLTTKSGYKIILQDYFAKNGKFPIKNIKTDSTTEDVLTNLVDYVNDHYIKGAGQNWMAGVAKSLTTTVFDDTIDAGEAQLINASGGNDTIYSGDGDNTLVGGTGHNTIIYEYLKDTSFFDQNTYGSDTIKLTKGEVLDIKVVYTDDSDSPVELTFERGTGKGKNDLIIKNAACETDKITVKNYYGTTTNATVKINGVNLAETSAFDFNHTHISANGALTTSALSDSIDMSGLTEPTKIKKGIEYGVTINAGAGDDTMTGSRFNDTFIGGAGKNKIILKNGYFGEDTVKLTKGETLYIEKEDGVSFSYSQGRNKKDLLITTNTGSTLTLKNYYAKNTGATVFVDGHDLTEEAIMDPINAGNYFEEPDPKIKMRAKYTGSNLADNVDASEITKATKTKKGVEYGVTIDGKGGSDVIVGSNYVDTIKAGTGLNDSITGGRGNDKLYASTTNGSSTTFNFRVDDDGIGDGNDVVYSGKGDDTLNFGDVNLADLEFERGVNKKGKPTNDLIIYYNHDEDGVAQDSVTVKDFYKTKKGKSTTSIRHIVAKDGSFDIGQMLEPPVIQTLDSTHPAYNNVASNRPHVITSTDTGSYEITLGDSSSNIVNVTGGSAYNITLGDGDKNEVTVGEEDNILEGAYASVTIGDGDENKIHLYKTGSSTVAHVGNGNGNEIIVGGTEYMVNTYASIGVGNGNNNKIITNNSGNSIITIKNGDNNEVYSYGTGYTNINASVGYSYSEEGDTHLGSTYMEVGYNQGETRSSADIQSFGNDTIKGLGQVNVTLQNPTTTTKTFVTNFDYRDVTTKSQTNVNIAGNSANINIELQDDIVDNEYTTYFSLVNTPSLGPVSPAYDFVYGAMDKDGNIIDGEIFIDDAYVQGGLYGSYIFRFNENELFVDSEGVHHGLDDEIQLYDMARMNSHDFIYQRDIVYKGGKGLIVNGTAEDDSIIAYGATINAKGGTNSIISGGNDIINVTGVDNIYFSTDDIDEETGEMVNTYKTIILHQALKQALKTY